jgi:hypothetical protein
MSERSIGIPYANQETVMTTATLNAAGNHVARPTLAALIARLARALKAPSTPQTEDSGVWTHGARGL